MRASQRGPPGVCVKYRHNKAPLLPCPRTILTHFFPFSLRSPTSPPAFIIHPQVPFGLPAFPLLGSNHFLLQLYASVGFPPPPPDCSPSSILRRPLLLSSAGQEIHRHRISHARFSRSFVSRLLPAPAASPGTRGRDLLGMVSRSGEQQPVKCFIDHLVVRTFLCTLSSDHADGGPRSLEIQRGGIALVSDTLECEQ